MTVLRRTVAFILSLGFLGVAMGSAGGLLWALVDPRHAARRLGSWFAVIAICETAVALYALRKGITFLSDSPNAAHDKPTHTIQTSNPFRK